MTEDVVADFTGRFFFTRGSDGDGTPLTGRVIATKKRLVLVAEDAKETVPLSRVIDINVGTVPTHVKQFFDDTLTIGYKTDEGTQSAVIESRGETVDGFVAILFRCLLNGQKVAVKHPARVGGRVKDSPVVPGKIRLDDHRIEVRSKGGTFGFDVETVMQIDRTNKIGSNDRVTLVVKHADPDTGKTTTSLIAPAKSQYVNLLARFLRLEYDALREETEDIELSNPEKRVLVGVHATGGDIDFTNMLDGDPAYVTNVLNSVKNKGLIVENGSGISLTATGRIIVSQRIEDVNAGGTLEALEETRANNR
ncbi:CheF family chemotaxis protein [Natronolimnobius baerhuensis]|uniref:Fla operon protein n=1 Tax=Natronolimnobius baerhuensis TaxID=253108 RepID=A0A202EAK4_9EURY|nr:CheF family chemotaxis protein [Natronolimnobius baerhuensis]OVE84990.1 fla operon protein [Natronolimnobius baerhuensis]